MSQPSQAAASVREAIRCASHGLIERESLVELAALAAVAYEHVLVIGPPGTGKSEAVRRISQALGGAYFEYLLGRFTEPTELFGTVDLKRLREGAVETDTSGMLPEAEIAFLDEVFRGSTAILNTLLGILNERTFRRGHTVMRCPLRLCVGAANELPTDESLAAFADRFLVHVFVEPVGDALLEALLEQGAALDQPQGAVAGIAALDELSALRAAVDLTAVRGELAHAVRLLRRAGIALSDRRIVRTQRLIAAAAAIDGRAAAKARDLWPLVYVIPTAELQAHARDVLRDVLAASRSDTAPRAAEDAAAGPAARAARLVEQGRAALAARPADAGAVSAWKLKLESIAREIDAGFAADALPAELAGVRADLVGELQETP